MNQINELRQLDSNEQKELVLERILESIDLSRWDAGDILNSMQANEDVLERIPAIRAYQFRQLEVMRGQVKHFRLIFARNW